VDYTGATDSAAESVVDGADVGSGQTWTCAVEAGDGDATSSVASSSVTTEAACTDDYALTFSGGSTGTCCCTGGNVGNSYILADVSPALSGASTATIEFWLFLDTYTQYGQLMRSNGSAGPIMTNTSDCGYGANQYKTALEWAGATLWSHDVAALSAWQHYALVFDAGTIRYFIDGTLQSTATGSPTVPTITGDVLYFGGRTDISNGNNQNQVNGSYRSIRISSTARYTADFVPAERLEADGDTFHLYSLDEGTGSIVYDSVDASYVGTIVDGSNTAVGWSLYAACP